MISLKYVTGLLVIGLTLGGIGLAIGSGDHDDDDDGRSYFKSWIGHSTSATASAGNSRYTEECGSCHFAYQPGLLPAPSWERIMTGLSDHFGDNAELEAEDRRAITNYLLDNAAGRVDDGLANRIMVSQRVQRMPIRITQTRFFRHEHDEIPPRMVQDNPDVLSFANCNACHTQAAAGSYNEHQVKIPGYGQWDD